MSQPSTSKRWNGFERVDGVTIDYVLAYGWIVRNGSTKVEVCPCCDKVMQSSRAAKLVADAVFPLPDSDEGQIQ